MTLLKPKKYLWIFKWTHRYIEKSFFQKIEDFDGRVVEMGDEFWVLSY